jgi:SAM-dependent methyltransferase
MKITSTSARAWEALARTDPYFAVLTDEKFKAENFTDEARDVFWTSGRNYFQSIADLLADHFGLDLRPRRALDFGCGVGRLLIPIAQVSGTALGVDASPTMLELARSNCACRGLTNVSFDASIPSSTSFDFINSSLVLQHIPRPIGFRLLDRLVSALQPGGAIAFDVLCKRSDTMPGLALARWLRATIPPVNWAVNLACGRAAGTPYMQMNPYPISRVLAHLEAAGCRDPLVQVTTLEGFETAHILAVKSKERIEPR